MYVRMVKNMFLTFSNKKQVSTWKIKYTFSGLPVYILKGLKHVVGKMVGYSYFPIVPDVYCVIT